AEDLVRCGTCDDVVGAGPADHRVEAVERVDRVGAAVAEDEVRPGYAAEDRVTAVGRIDAAHDGRTGGTSGSKRVGAFVAEQVGTSAGCNGLDTVIADAADDGVAAGRHDDGVIALITEHHVGGTGNTWVEDTIVAETADDGVRPRPIVRIDGVV